MRRKLYAMMDNVLCKFCVVGFDLCIQSTMSNAIAGHSPLDPNLDPMQPPRTSGAVRRV